MSPLSFLSLLRGVAGLGSAGVQGEKEEKYDIMYGVCKYLGICTSTHPGRRRPEICERNNQCHGVGLVVVLVLNP